MRTSPAIVFVTALAMTPALYAQGNNNQFKSASPEAQRATRHYKSGWEAIHRENWDEAVREFQAALDADDKFALAYYSLGRAQMGLKNFPQAITAYTACKNLYLRIGGERFTNQLEYRKRLEDRILEYQTTIQQAQGVSAGKSSTQSQSLYLQELRNQLTILQQAKDRNDNIEIDASVPYFVPMALGAAYFRSGQFADAEREYMAAIEANPGSGETHNNLAVLYLTTGRVGLAEKEIEKAESTGFKVNPGLKDEIQKKKAGL